MGKEKKGNPLLTVLLIVVVIWIASFGQEEEEPPKTTDPVVETQFAANTHPAATVPQETYPNIPAHLQEHLALDWRGEGNCDYMTGNIVALVVLIDDAESSWSAQDVELLQQQQSLAASRMSAEAGQYGTYLNIRLEYCRVTMQEVLNEDAFDTWVDRVLLAAGYPGTAQTGAYLESQFGADSAPVFFYINKVGRSFAQPIYGEGTEYAVFFRDAADFRHEMIHIYGGRDYYFPELYATVAGALFPDSIMLGLTGEPTVDSLSAYMIGWTDELSAEGYAFLQQTVHFTDADMGEAYAEEVFTGYRTKETTNGVYTGNWYKGAIQGYGVMNFYDGSIYDGYWEYGTFEGQGTMYYADGAVCTGNWVDGMQHGYCEFTWADGTNYKGDWYYGAITGYGTMTWTNGVVYTGNWQNGNCVG